MPEEPPVCDTTNSYNIDARAWKRCMSALRRCLCARHLHAAHALFISHGLHRNTFAFSRLIATACSLSLPSYASLLFSHAASPPNSFIFNTLIRTHSRGAHPHHALSFFLLMLRSAAAAAAEALAPDHHTFPFVLTACASSPPLLPFGKQVHAWVFKNGLASADHYVQTALLRLYGGSPDDAHKLFDEIPLRDAVQWDVLMNGFLRCNAFEGALRVFNDMLKSGVEADEFIFTTALTACAHAGSLEQGVWIHRLVEEKMGRLYLRDTFIGSALVSMYAKCGCIGDAVKVFDQMPQRNTYVWSAMIGGYAMHGLAEEAISCLERMLMEDGLHPDGIVVLGALAACAHAGRVKDGLWLLTAMEKCYGLVPEHEHYSCAVDMLCRVGRLEDAVGLIRRMPMRPLASVWGSLLTGCRSYGNIELAELAVEELQKITHEEGDREGVYVQLSNIYLDANKQEDARRVRKLIGTRGIKKTPAYSSIEVDGAMNSFVAGDQVHPLRLEICRVLDLLMDHMSERRLCKQSTDLTSEFAIVVESCGGE